jgi:hypothetical protein
MPRLLLLALLLSLPTAALAQVTLPCTLAERLDADTYVLVSGADPSEAGQDWAAVEYARCQAAGLSRDLKTSPQLAARMARLRDLYQTLIGLDGQLASALAGGGTLYAHSVPRQYPALEASLKSSATLAGSRFGAQTGRSYGASIHTSQQEFVTTVAALRKLRPDPQYSVDVTLAGYLKLVGDFEVTGRAVMALLGNRPDAATAAAYRPLGAARQVSEFVQAP